VFSAGTADAAVSLGKAFAWGYNYNGELGNDTHGEGTEMNISVAVSNLQGVKNVKAGCEHGLALKNDGTVRAWGYNYDGELSNGNTGTDSDVPVRVKIDNVKAISAGCLHNLALKENGTVWARGDNYYGELGIGTYGAGTESKVPVKVASLGTGVKAVAAGSGFSLALMKDGTVRSWGDDFHGQLGNGANPFRDEPGPVGNLSNVKAIATDGDAAHVLALLENGTVRSWGRNYDGQLGDGSTLPGASRETPVRVANLTGVEAVAVGGLTPWRCFRVAGLSHGATTITESSTTAPMASTWTGARL
jgi:alpha-tubulin suppressor-like RCC1 family protein